MIFRLPFNGVAVEGSCKTTYVKYQAEQRMA
jgi:hypothetical protein